MDSYSSNAGCFTRKSAAISVIKISYPGFTRSLENYGKNFCHFPVWKSLEKNLYWSACMAKENYFPDLIF